jgi:hypothetical protein
MIGMSDRGERLSALGHGLGPQVRDAIFGDDETDLAPRRRDDAIGEAGDDARLAVSGNSLERDDRRAARRARSPADEIDLPSDRPDVDAAERLGIDLSREVDLERAC